MRWVIQAEEERQRKGDSPCLNFDHISHVKTAQEHSCQAHVFCLNRSGEPEDYMSFAEEYVVVL